MCVRSRECPTSLSHVCGLVILCMGKEESSRGESGNLYFSPAFDSPGLWSEMRDMGSGDISTKPFLSLFIAFRSSGF